MLWKSSATKKNDLLKWNQTLDLGSVLLEFLSFIYIFLSIDLNFCKKLIAKFEIRF